MKRAIVIGASFGGLQALRTIILGLPNTFKTPIVIVLHIGNNNIDSFISLLNKNSSFGVKEAEEKEKLKPGTVYFAPPNYHLQIETTRYLSLSADTKVNYSRPSIDVLFETAAWALNNKLVGVLLTGSNADGARGLKTIKDFGGTTLVENPETALAPKMPQEALKLSTPDYILDVEQIADKLAEICS